MEKLRNSVKNVQISVSDKGYFRLIFSDNKGKRYTWSSKNHVLTGLNSGNRLRTRLSNIFGKRFRKFIRDELSSSKNKQSPNYEPKIKMRKQQGGTCWFHGLLSGLLLSPYSRKLVIKRIEEMNSSNNMGIKKLFGNVNGNSCPSRTASSTLFWSYIRHRLEGKGNVNAMYKNAQVIQNLGLRKRGLSKLIPRIGKPYLRRAATGIPFVHGGGLLPDVNNFYSKLFPYDYKVGFEGTSTPNIIITKLDKQHFNDFVRHNDTLYRLSHCIISLWMPAYIGGHMISGFVTKYGNHVIYDSGDNMFYKNIPWNSSAYDKKMLKIFRDVYRFNFTTIKKRAFYIKI